MNLSKYWTLLMKFLLLMNKINEARFKGTNT